jgi:serine/threonine protein kinase
VFFISGNVQTKTHVCLITDFCPGGELFALLERQPCKAFSEEAVRFFMAEIIIALEYLHCLGMALVLSITLLSAFIEFYEPSQQCRILMHSGTECGVIFAS